MEPALVFVAVTERCIFGTSAYRPGRDGTTVSAPRDGRDPDRDVGGRPAHQYPRVFPKPGVTLLRTGQFVRSAPWSISR